MTTAGIPQNVDVCTSAGVHEFETTLQDGELVIEGGKVTAIRANMTLSNWDFFRNNHCVAQPYVKAVEKDHIKRLIIYDDPIDLEYEPKVDQK